jgi:hypothetical protein
MSRYSRGGRPLADWTPADIADHDTRDLNRALATYMRDEVDPPEEEE